MAARKLTLFSFFSEQDVDIESTQNNSTTQPIYIAAQQNSHASYAVKLAQAAALQGNEVLDSSIRPARTSWFIAVCCGGTSGRGSGREATHADL